MRPTRSGNIAWLHAGHPFAFACLSVVAGPSKTDANFRLSSELLFLLYFLSLPDGIISFLSSVVGLEIWASAT